MAYSGVAYEHACNIAHTHGGAGRDSEMPHMRDHQTMARRIRGYVTQSKTSTSLSSSAPGRATSGEHKALQRQPESPTTLETDRDGEYAQTARKNLQRASSRRAVKSRVSKRDIANCFERTFIDSGTWPTSAEAMKEFNVSRPTVARALKEAGITLLRRRRTSQK